MLMKDAGQNSASSIAASRPGVYQPAEEMACVRGLSVAFWRLQPAERVAECARLFIRQCRQGFAEYRGPRGAVKAGCAENRDESVRELIGAGWVEAAWILRSGFAARRLGRIMRSGHAARHLELDAHCMKAFVCRRLALASSLGQNATPQYDRTFGRLVFPDGNSQRYRDSFRFEARSGRRFVSDGECGEYLAPERGNYCLERFHAGTLPW